MRHFPDELLQLVLKDVCGLDPDEFDFAHRSHGPRQLPYIIQPRTAPLLVCRSWRRVAHQPLYAVIILSTAAQAHSLARTLGDQPKLGLYVRKLLFNGAFGAAPKKILKATPHITDIGLSLGISSSESSRGLCAALPHIQPRSLRLNDTNNAFNNAQTRALMAVICSCIRGGWTSLVEARFPYEPDMVWPEKVFNQGELLAAMRDAPYLKIVHMPAPYNVPAVASLLANPTLSAIHSETPFGVAMRSYARGIWEHIEIQDLDRCGDIRFPLPGPWALGQRPYEGLHPHSNNIRLMFVVRPDVWNLHEIFEDDIWSYLRY
ncbi:hypothetical protein FB451DRAFT_1236801 [Mycena latifolia]|nr:hypothetical protein FB451DRAFT_1236801 [Mycena latifolia]